MLASLRAFLVAPAKSFLLPNLQKAREEPDTKGRPTLDIGKQIA